MHLKLRRKIFFLKLVCYIYQRLSKTQNQPSCKSNSKKSNSHCFSCRLFPWFLVPGCFSREFCCMYNQSCQCAKIVLQQNHKKKTNQTNGKGWQAIGWWNRRHSLSSQNISPIGLRQYLLNLIATVSFEK